MVFLGRDVPDLAAESGFFLGSEFERGWKNPKINNGGQQQQFLVLLLRGGRGRGDDDDGGVPRGLFPGQKRIDAWPNHFRCLKSSLCAWKIDHFGRKLKVKISFKGTKVVFYLHFSVKNKEKTEGIPVFCFALRKSERRKKEKQI